MVSTLQSGLDLLTFLSSYALKKYEFWHPRVFELPYYLYLGWQCLLNMISIRTLAKANYALDHGEIGLGSKLESQLAFDQRFFLPSVLVPEGLDLDDKKQLIFEFIDKHDYPVILKSNVGCVGKGIAKVSSPNDVDKHTPRLLGDYILQKFTSFPFECGVFYTRLSGQSRVTGINKKHFPTVTGNGRDDILSLAKNHPRYTQHWDSFLQELDTSEILKEGQEKRISFIGSHTLGCKFTDDTESLLTPDLEAAIFELFESQAGFNFGRVDVKCLDEESFKRGEFVVIEVNGVASLPTHMFDPDYTVWQAYGIFLEHAKILARIAREQRHQPMSLLRYSEVIQRAKANAATLNRVHQKLMGREIK